MKILFYVEIHPIRQSFTGHSWFVKEFMKTNLDNDIKFLANHKVQEIFNKNNIFIKLTQEEKLIIESFYNSKWDEQAINDWKSLMLGSNKVYNKFYSKLLDRVKQIYNFDILVYWGTNNTIKNYCDNIKIPSVSLELGCTRDPYFYQTYYMDLDGVNGANSISKISFDIIKRFKTIISSKSIIKEQEKPESCLNMQIDNCKHSNILYQNWGWNVLIPLQLDDDSNIILYTKYNSVLDFVKETISKFKNTQYKCYIKPHPGRKARIYNDIKHNKIKQYISNIPNVYWLDDTPTIKAIEKSNIIITLNSSLAFEAMILKKIVINNGGCCWNVGGIFPNINQILRKKFDYDKYIIKVEKITSFLLEYYLIPNKFFNYGFLKNYLNKLFKIYYAKLEGKDFHTLIQPINTVGDYISNYSDLYKLGISHEDSRHFIGELLRNTKVIQKIICIEANLSKIELFVGTFRRKNACSIRVSICQDYVKTIRVVEKSCLNILDNSWEAFEFEPIKNSVGKVYYIIVESFNARIGNAITLYYSKQNNISLLNLSINNVRMGGSLTMKTWYARS